MHVDEFLKTGGIAEWLNGLEYIPQRLKNLNEINKLLAHRPWLITKEHIQVPLQSCPVNTSKCLVKRTAKNCASAWLGFITLRLKSSGKY